MTGRRTVWLVVAMLSLGSACTSRDADSVPKEIELGAHRVQVSTPAGWELLDQGRQKRFRRGESEIVLERLGPMTLADTDAIALGGTRVDQRREVKSRRAIKIDQREAMEIDTWNRLDHTWPQRYLFVRADDDLLVLSTPRLADDETVEAFERIRDSLHFVVNVSR
jgi:hypothetical protein